MVAGEVATVLCVFFEDRNMVRRLSLPLSRWYLLTWSAEAYVGGTDRGETHGCFVWCRR